jgi:hypothetical protein
MDDHSLCQPYIQLHVNCFSFTSISTFGYGDIHLTTGLAKILAISEAFVGTVTFALVFGCLSDERIGDQKTKAE